MPDFAYCKLEIFIPESHFAALQKALQAVDAGHIGRYDCCLSYSRVIGCWRPLAGTDPYIGRENEISEEPGTQGRGDLPDGKRRSHSGGRQGGPPL